MRWPRDPAGPQLGQLLPVLRAGTTQAAADRTGEVDLRDALARLHAAGQRGAIPAGFHELPRSYFPESVIDLPGSSG